MQTAPLPESVEPGPINSLQTRGVAATASGFGGQLRQAMDAIHQLETDASASVKGLLSGDGTDVHAAMIASQKAGMAFELALAVRNKLVASYQQLMSTQF